MAMRSIPMMADAEMKPPVALLIYRPERPGISAFYPFAVFSPEWQAIQYALKQGVPVRFMDLPLANQLGPVEVEAEAEAESEAEEAEARDEPDTAETTDEATTEPPEISLDPRIRVDPLQVLAEAAGFDDGETWWEHVVEHRRDGADLFAAILEAMAAVRESVSDSSLTNPREEQREAYMRQTIRAAQKEGKRRIAVDLRCLACPGAGAGALAVGLAGRCDPQGFAQNQGGRRVGPLDAWPARRRERLRRGSRRRQAGIIICGRPPTRSPAAG